MIEPNIVFASLIKSPIVTSLQEDGTKRNAIEWKIPTDLPYFNGHFPGTPVFPAVGIIDASIVLLRRVLDAPQLQFSTVDSAKFLNLIGPGAQVRIEWSEDENSVLDVNWLNPLTQETLATVSLKPK
jgi:3-hydroxymyristoyl/3-hydroxydecanoyl-(acyl carrier protein) dehydratase